MSCEDSKVGYEKLVHANNNNNSMINILTAILMDFNVAQT